MFITVRIASIFVSSTSLHIYDFHVFTVIYLPLQGFIWNQHNDQLPVGLLAQVVKHCTSITEVNSIRPEFFSGLIFTTALVEFRTARIASIFISSTAVSS